MKNHTTSANFRISPWSACLSAAKIFKRKHLESNDTNDQTNVLNCEKTIQRHGSQTLVRIFNEKSVILTIKKDNCSERMNSHNLTTLHNTIKHTTMFYYRKRYTAVLRNAKTIYVLVRQILKIFIIPELITFRINVSNWIENVSKHIHFASIPTKIVGNDNRKH